MSTDARQADDTTGENADQSTENRSHESKYGDYEPWTISGKNVPLKGKGSNKTIAQCGIGDGDTLHLLLQDRKVQIPIHNNIQNDIDTPILSTSKSILDLKKDIKADQGLPSYLNSVVNYQSLVLKINEDQPTEMENTKIVADYIQDHFNEDDRTLNVYAPTYNISVLVPRRQEIERVLFEAHHYTVRQFCADVRKRKASFGPPGLFLGAVKSADGALTYLRLDTIFFVLEIFKPDGKVGEGVEFCLKRNHTLSDIYKMIEGDNAYRRFPWKSTQLHYRFVDTWTREFAPRIQAEATPIDGNKALRLYYYPVYHDEVPVGRYYSLRPVQEVLDAVCQIRGLNSANRVLKHARSGRKLAKTSQLAQHHDLFESNPLMLLEIGYERSTPDMKVYVPWLLSRVPLVELRVTPNDTVNSLIDQIEDVLQVPNCVQKLTVSQRIIRGDSGTLEEVGITDGWVLGFGSFYTDDD